MKLSGTSKIVIASAACFCLGSLVMAQFKIGELIKVVGVGAAVSKFGPDINKAANKVSNWHDTPQTITKVVPIISGGINSRKAVGAAQVKGPRAYVNKVNAVALLNQDLFGQLKINVYIPISSKNIVSDIKGVPMVGVSAVVDLNVNI